jgi:hypothetical protein
MPERRVRLDGKRIVVIVHVHEDGGAMTALVIEQAAAGLPALANVGEVQAYQAVYGLIEQVGGVVGE